MNLVKTIGRILPVAISLAVLVACGDKKSEKAAPVKQPEPAKVEAPAPEPEQPAPFDFSKFAAIKNNSQVFLTTNSEVEAFLNDAFAKVENGQATSIEFPNVSSMFELASAELSSEGRAVIATLGSKFAQTNVDAASLLVEGYTCDLGSVGAVLKPSRLNSRSTSRLPRSLPSGTASACSRSSSTAPEKNTAA